MGVDGPRSVASLALYSLRLAVSPETRSRDDAHVVGVSVFVHVTMMFLCVARRVPCSSCVQIRGVSGG